MNTDNKTFSTQQPYRYVEKTEEKIATALFSVVHGNGTREDLNTAKLEQSIIWASKGYEQLIEVTPVLNETIKNIFDGISTTELADALILAATAFIERDPAYNIFAARLLLKKLFREVTGISIRHADAQDLYRTSFIASIERGVARGVLDPRMLDFDLEKLAQGLVLERDVLGFMGLKTLYERYFTKVDGVRLELPQSFWMRVAMGVSLLEEHKTERALEFYTLMSSLNYVPSTPTLLHSGLVCPQLSSCYLATVEDDLAHIFKCIGDNAQLSKWSGGVAYDWTNVRATGALIKSIGVESQGVIPFLKVASDTTAAINRSGKRRSAAVVYLETWHLDIEDFLDLRRNTGDERRRTHDINTANWVPDLFMKRVIAEKEWTLFSPEEVPDLHHLYGKAFEKRYEEYEQMIATGTIKKFKVIEAVKLWRKMLSRLFETGHPWIAFKDVCNIRSPQDHVGVVHSSNLCTEITLNTSADETAVCNLGSVNLGNHINNGALDGQLLEKTVTTALRMLDNVIDINFYPTKEAKYANMRHRPVGLGVMGFQDALYKLNISFDSPQALTFADETQEKIAYYAILASSQLAKERGVYETYTGSKWDRNIFPQDTLALVEQERGMPIDINKKGMLDWQPVRDQVKKYGMRNSNTMAIAPTATISNIAGCYPCIEPIYKNLYVKSNMSGEFTVVNHYLVDDLKKRNLWNTDILEQLKYYDGSVQMMECISDDLKHKYKEAFELDPEWLVAITAARGKWIDQAQAHNVFMKGVSGKNLSALYLKGWQAGMKTFYYLRTMAATQIEKSTLDAKKFGFTQTREYTSIESGSSPSASSDNEVNDQLATESLTSSEEMLISNRSCSLSTDPECDVCQ